jgi:hypothetical protein
MNVMSKTAGMGVGTGMKSAARSTGKAAGTAEANIATVNAVFLLQLQIAAKPASDLS